MPENLTSRQKLIVTAADAGRRLDLFLAQGVPTLSRTRIQELIEGGRVRVDGRSAKASHRVATGEAIEVEVIARPSLTAGPEDLPLELLLVDDEFVVVNKPAG